MRRNHPERHAERAVDQLRREADQDEGQDVGEADGGQIEQTRLPARRDKVVRFRSIEMRRAGANVCWPEWLRARGRGRG